MSFLIKGINLPETCIDCPCCHDLSSYNQEYYLCSAAEHAPDVTEIRETGRLHNCPLVEVPTPHGRLIDAYEIEKCVHEWYDVGEYVFADTIRNADTIIEAEASE